MPAESPPEAAESPPWWWRSQSWWRDAQPTYAVTLRTVSVPEIIDLRRDVLRAGRRDMNAGLVDDDAPTSCHLGAFGSDHDDLLLGCVSLVARPAESRAVQLSLMAVTPNSQGQGIGAAIVRCAQGLVVSAPEPYSAGIWANARDTALGFYERLGFEVFGDGFISSMDLPHHRVRWSPGDAAAAPK